MADRLSNLSNEELQSVRTWAQDRIAELRDLLSELHMLNGRIMGVSGDPGFLEMTSDRTRLEREVNIMVDNRDQSNRVNIGPGASISGTVVVAREVTDAFKTTITGSDAPDSMKNHLSNLCGEIDKILPLLSSQQQADVRKDIDTLVNEATKVAPRRKWYELSADGIVEAAKTCGAVAGPVIAAVQKVVSLLS
jgi:hypothetical protein